MHLEPKRLTTKIRASKMFFSPKLPIPGQKNRRVGLYMMKLRVLNRFPTEIIFIFFLFGLLAVPVTAQAPMEPEHARLLNGLRILIWSRPDDKDVLLKLRIHSGAAFDLSGKGGSMALLGDILFPDPATHEYFTEEMQGRLNVVTNYDSITITMQGRASDFERIVEILRTALVSTELTPENVKKIRDARLKIVKETAVSPAFVADRAIAARMFGDFPYGRPYSGTAESLERVERADLMLARDRFLSPNNATLTVIGGVPANRAMRALRQLLGVWRKSELVVPSTFRQPNSPDARTLVIDTAADQSAEVRLGWRGLSRQDPDTAAANLLAILVRQRWSNTVPELAKAPSYVRHDAFTLPGMFVMGATVDNLLVGKTLSSARVIMQSFANTVVAPAELDQVRAQALAALNLELAKPDGIADAWLDGDTYSLPSVAERVRAINNVTPADIQRVAARITHDGPATVVLGNAEVLKAQIQPLGKIEVMGEIAPSEPKVEPKTELKNKSNVKPQVKTP